MIVKSLLKQGLFVAAALALAIERFEAEMQVLARQLGDRDYVCGDALSAADIVIGHLLYRWFTIDISRAANPVVEAYYRRLSERPAFRAHVMVSYDALRVDGA